MKLVLTFTLFASLICFGQNEEYSTFFDEILLNLKTKRVELKTLETEIFWYSKDNWEDTLNQNEISYIVKQMDIKQRKFKKSIFKNFEIVNKKEAKFLLNNSVDTLSFTNAFYTFSLPIYLNLNKNKVGVWMEYNCGRYCSEKEFNIYIKQNGKWVLNETRFQTTW